MSTFMVYTKRLLIIAVCLLFIMFLSVDVYDVEFPLPSKVLKFLTILLCMVISIISSTLKRQSKNIFLLQLGLIFTTMADYIFLIHGDNYSIAIGLFSIVQIVYSLRYREGNELMRILGFGIIYFVIIIIYKMIGTYFNINFLIVISVFYGICLISSLKEAIYLFKDNSYIFLNRIILLGMILFFLCDINLGFNYILGSLNNIDYVLNLLKRIASISIWMYYIPSQILLSLSGSLNFNNQ